MVFDRGITAVIDAPLELYGGALPRFAYDVRAVDALPLHFGKQVAAHGIRTKPAGPADLQPQPRQANRHIGFGTCGAFVEGSCLFDRARLIGHEHQHGLAKGHDLQRLTQSWFSNSRSCRTALRVVASRSSPTSGYSIAWGTSRGMPRRMARHGAAESARETATQRVG